MDKNDDIKLGLVGLGYWGKNILRNLYELGVLDTVCDASSKIIEERRKEFPSLKFSSSFDDILENPQIKAVVVATPAATHYELTKKALNANKDVFVEKPLALKHDNGKELVALAKEKNKILMVGHILQYHPAIIKLKEMIEKGELGKLQYICSNRLNIGKLRVEENILWSFAPHDISVILMLTGEEPSKINSFGESYLSKGIADVTLTTLEFKNNVKAHIFVSWLHPYKEQKLIIVGTKAMAVFDDLTKEKLFIYPHKIEWEDGKTPVAHKAQHYSVEVGDKEPLKEEMKHFIECVSKRKTPQTDGNEGLRVLKVLEEAEKSIVSKGEPISTSKNKGYFVHTSSCVDENVEIGEGTKIWNFSHILKDSKIGKNCVISQNVMIGPEVEVGNKCKIQNNVSIYKGVTLEDGVFCGPSCVFTNVINPRSFIERKDEFRTTLVKKGSSIGANATIVCGVTIGSYAFIGAGAVVTKDIPDFGLVYGNPAKLQGWMCECGVKLQFEKDKAICKACNKKYKKVNNKIQGCE